MSETRIIRRSLPNRQTGRTDWDRLNHQTDADIDAAIASDPDAVPALDDEWLAKAELTSRGKKLISIRLDPEILEFFQNGGKNYQTRINNVLKAYVEAKKKSA